MIILECGMGSSVSQPLISVEILFSCQLCLSNSSNQKKIEETGFNFIGTNWFWLVPPLLLMATSLLIIVLLCFITNILAQEIPFSSLTHTRKYTQVGVKRHTEAQISTTKFQEGRTGWDQHKMLKITRLSQEKGCDWSRADKTMVDTDQLAVGWFHEKKPVKTVQRGSVIGEPSSWGAKGGECGDFLHTCRRGLFTHIPQKVDLALRKRHQLLRVTDRVISAPVF